MTNSVPAGKVHAVCASPTYTMAKPSCAEIELVAGLGVAGDVHAGVTVKHRSRVKRGPTQPNLRQVHLIHRELLDELQRKGHDIASGRLGENITTEGIDLLNLPTDTLLAIGGEAVVRLTGLRNPCRQIEDISPGLLKLVLGHNERGDLVRKAGVMGVVVHPGVIRPGDQIAVTIPAGEHASLQPV